MFIWYLNLLLCVKQLGIHLNQVIANLKYIYNKQVITQWKGGKMSWNQMPMKTEYTRRGVHRAK